MVAKLLLAWTDYATLAIADVTLKSLSSPEAQKKGIIKYWWSQEKALDSLGLGTMTLMFQCLTARAFKHLGTTVTQTGLMQKLFVKKANLQNAFPIRRQLLLVVYNHACACCRGSMLQT